MTHYLKLGDRVAMHIVFILSFPLHLLVNPFLPQNITHSLIITLVWHIGPVKKERNVSMSPESSDVQITTSSGIKLSSPRIIKGDFEEGSFLGLQFLNAECLHFQYKILVGLT